MLLGRNVVDRIIAMMPGQESVTLGSRGAGESGYTSVTYANARRKPAKREEVMLSGFAFEGNEWTTFGLYKTTESTAPKIGDRITDAESVVWQIKSIDAKMERTVFNCLCLKNKA